jgi:hypothetical protein
MRVLLLDFDGVTHPIGGQPGATLPFVYLPALEDLVRKWADVHIVISSSWREHHTLEELREFFSEDLRQRVIGVTPLIQCEAGRGQRQKECHAWLRLNAPEAAWIAIDDEALHYDESSDPVVICDPLKGLSDPAVLVKIERWMKVAR